MLTHDETRALERLTGASVGDAPFVEEALAVGLSQPVLAAEVGLRYLRERSIVSRFLDAITGSGASLENCIGNDMVHAHRATIGAVRLLMTEVTRSRVCSIRVLQNLHQVNAGLDAVEAKQVATDDRVDQLGNELALTAGDLRLLTGEVDEVRQRTRRDAEIRRLSARFCAHALHPGMGDLLGAAFFVAVSLRHTEGNDPREVQAERRTLLATVGHRLGRRVAPSSELFERAISELRPELIPAVQLVLDGGTPGIRVLLSLADGRAAADSKGASHLLATLRAQDAGSLWAPHLLRPVEFVEYLADELVAAGIR